MPGEPNQMTYYKDIVRYLTALDKASDRVTMFKIGVSDEGRDMFAIAVADEATIKQIDKYRQITAQLTDPRKLTDAQAKQLIATGKPIYFATGAIHSPEVGSPEMLMELAFRLAVEETPFIQTIRNNSIVVINPASEVDGREKQVDNFMATKAGKPSPSMVYWGKYVQHDNNRDGIGVGLRLTQVMLKTFLDWHPTVFHDLHESATLLYTSTGTGPYNTVVDPIQTNEWWLLAETEVMELTKRNVPGVWTYNYYDGWVPNYMFWIGVTHNSIGRFYETQSYGGAQNRALGALNQSREWYRQNPTPNDIQWGPRANVNMQQSAILIAMNHVAKNKDTFLENYYLKNKHTVERGQTKAPHAYVVPARQRRPVEAAELMNLIRREGAEVHTATSAFSVGNVQVAPGDYIVRMDQPYNAIVETLLGVQFYAPQNPRPYDDTGWAIALVRNVKAQKIDDKAILQQPMTLAAADFKISGTITGSGRVIIVDHNTDNTLVTFRFQHAGVKMSAAEKEFEAAGHTFGAGAFIIPDANRAALEPSIKELGLSAWAVDAAPAVAMHDLDVPRIGYVHTWNRTQDEGWVRLAFDTFKVPYTYFGAPKLREGDLRAKYDVIVFPHAGAGGADLITGGVTGNEPRPYKKTDLTPNVGTIDSTDDMRGNIGIEGLMELYKFVQQGGVFITEGATSTVFPEYNLTPGVNVETPEGLYVRGSVLKALVGDRTSPVLYGYDQNALAVYFNQAPVMSVGGGGGFGGGRGGRGGASAPGVPNMQPNAAPSTLTTLDGPPVAAAPGAGGRGGRQGGAGRGGFAGPGGGGAQAASPRVLLSFPTSANDLLLSGLLVGGDALTGRAVAIDSPIGKGHVVMFANRPFWRWQTQGNFFLAFNAILNWNDLDAGRTAARPVGTGTGGQR
ncbi:MAG: hypothetical protein A3H96_20835 [Acidobacteria bacterium RIFCSPLOWO2_02_FULL_67_36]|nr:MAG: hypothetical protein A3H96_20835 [Acidobacteria bacterium RIFCSPLOWO2_02_FULL_67_36]OFW25496.1 MAG: hypothetical protein A3G21_19420 [Acidobacteria bacterium RIFCSPLOWO2_12_FULL_66_21]